MVDTTNFRQRLDTVLRTRDVKQVSEFLIAEKQWQPGTPADPAFAMWMMIAGSPSLRELHEQARLWLIEHGHQDEANMVLRREKTGGGKQGKANTSIGKKGGNEAKRGQMHQKADTPFAKGKNRSHSG